MNDLAVIILAAGLGTVAEIPREVNHQVAGRSLLGHVQVVAEVRQARHLIPMS